MKLSLNAKTVYEIDIHLFTVYSTPKAALMEIPSNDCIMDKCWIFYSAVGMVFEKTTPHTAK